MLNPLLPIRNNGFLAWRHAFSILSRGGCGVSASAATGGGARFSSSFSDASFSELKEEEYKTLTLVLMIVDVRQIDSILETEKAAAEFQEIN